MIIHSDILIRDFIDIPITNYYTFLLADTDNKIT